MPMPQTFSMDGKDITRQDLLSLIRKQTPEEFKNFLTQEKGKGEDPATILDPIPSIPENHIAMLYQGLLEDYCKATTTEEKTIYKEKLVELGKYTNLFRSYYAHPTDRECIPVIQKLMSDIELKPSERDATISTILSLSKIFDDIISPDKTPSLRPGQQDRIVTLSPHRLLDVFPNSQLATIETTLAQLKTKESKEDSSNEEKLGLQQLQVEHARLIDQVKTSFQTAIDQYKRASQGLGHGNSKAKIEKLEAKDGTGIEGIENALDIKYFIKNNIALSDGYHKDSLNTFLMTQILIKNRDLFIRVLSEYFYLDVPGNKKEMESVLQTLKLTDAELPKRAPKAMPAPSLFSSLPPLDKRKKQTTYSENTKITVAHQSFLTPSRSLPSTGSTRHNSSAQVTKKTSGI